MPAVRTPGAPQATRSLTQPAIPPSPLRDRVGYSDHDRFRGHFPVHCHSGLQPPCLRFAVAVTGHHARLGTRLLARLYRGRHLRRQSSTRLQGATLTDPDLILSHHPARVIARRLPPSAEPSGSSRFDPSWPTLNGDDLPPSLHGHYPASSLLQGSPPLSGASVLSASRLEPLAPFPLASPARFSRSVQEPD